MVRPKRTWRVLSIAVGVGMVAIAGAGCAEDPPEIVNDLDVPPPNGVPSEIETPPIDEPNDRIELTEVCVNETFGVRIAYPSGWETRSGEMADGCSYFHPDPFDVPPATEVFDIAIQWSLEPVTLERIVDGLDFGAEVIAEEETSVEGREAIIVETESTGEALLPEGVRAYAYYIALGDDTLWVATHDVEGLDYEHNKRVLDAMMERVEFIE